MFLETTLTTKAVQKLFGKSHEEVVAKLGLTKNRLDPNPKLYPWGVWAESVPNKEATTRVRIGFKGYYSPISFSVAYYPSCCGNKLFHGFCVEEKSVTQDMLNEIMDAFFAENKDVFSSRRLEVIMVEHRYNEDGEHMYGTDPMADPEPIDNPNIRYKSLWNYFHTKARRVRTRLEVNANTGAILHNMEVIL